jgi:leucine--tRNA ligase
VLANEQVVNGACERCGTTVTKKSLNQWYFKITDYAQQLLDDMEQLEGKWPDRVLLMQRNWIGRSEGAEVRFEIEATEDQAAESFTVFTTRPDTLYGATFIVVAADAAFAEQIVAPEHKAALEQYREDIKALSDIDRQSSDREKTGVFTGRYAINPLTGAKLPVWASDYVLADYGTGAIMAVPAHDQRDLEFALKFDLPIVKVLDVEGAEDPATSGVAAAGDGVLINSGELTGLPKAEALAKAIELVEAAGTGEGKVIYRLRDWLLSRQRFWGTPIPVIHCEDCGEVLVPEDQLPVLLPDNLRGEQLAPKGQSPLAAADDWAVVPCPECGKQARRDSDTMDTFVDSSWYFLRYVSPNFDEGPFDPQAMSEWGAVDMYVGGVEHAILHLLYARFFTKVVRDLGLIKHDEPFKALMNQGQVLNGGKAMSKSLGNGVNLGEQLDKFGVDAIRTTMIFASPPEDDVDWADVSPSGSQKFLARAWRVAQDVTSEPGVDATTGDLELQKLIARTVHEVQGLLDNGKFNVVVAKTMELVNATRKAIDSGAGAADPAVRKAAETVAILLSLYAPYTAEDMWHALGHDTPVLTAGFPEVDPALLVDDTVTAIVQIKGKVKARLEVAKDISEQELQELALADAAVQRSIGDAEIRKVIVRAPKLVNIVI